MAVIANNQKGGQPLDCYLWNFMSGKPTCYSHWVILCLIGLFHRNATYALEILLVAKGTEQSSWFPDLMITWNIT